jgi:hypothetical protein
MTDYTRTALIDPTDIGEGGDVGGDVQLSDSLVSRLVFAENETGPFLVQDTYAYTVGLNASGEPVSFGDEGIVSYRAEISVHETECTDHTDPGSSEVHSNIIYRAGEGTYAAMLTPEELRTELTSWLECNVEESIDTETRS